MPTSFNKVTEEEFKARGVNIIIYANQLTKAGGCNAKCGKYDSEKSPCERM